MVPEFEVRPSVTVATPLGWVPDLLPPYPRGFLDVDFSTPHHRQPRLLQLIHPHPSDEKIQFEEGRHLYYIDGLQCCWSVTTLCRSHASEFDEAATVAKMREGENWPRPSYTHHRRLPLAEAAVALFYEAMAYLSHSREEVPAWGHQIDKVTQHVLGPSAQDPDPDTEELEGGTVGKICEAIQELRRLARRGTLPEAVRKGLNVAIEKVSLSEAEIYETWRVNREDAANRGTWFHLQVELWLNRDMCHIEGPDMRLFFRYIEAYLEPLKIEAFRTEWDIFDTSFDIAGRVDFVGRYTDGPFKGQLIVVDWKRTKGLSRTPLGCGMMKPPLNFIPDVKLWHCVLQLNVYAWIIEHCYGHKVAHLEVVGVHADNGDAPLILKVPWMRTVTHYLMAWQRVKCQEAIQRRGGSHTPLNEVLASLDSAERLLVGESLPALQFVNLPRD